MIRHLFLLQLFVLGVQASAQESTPQQHFDRHIAPLLSAKCLECHSGAKPKGGLDLSRREAAFRGGENGVAIKSGKPEESMLWQRIRDDEMPPENPLGNDEKKVLQKWIADGAKWGSVAIDRYRYTTATRAGYDWWSLQPLGAVTPPKVEDSHWPLTEIDQFVLKRLRENQLGPSRPAAPRILVRRLFYDLVGLPPSPEEIAKFEADPSQEAYVALVDQLLDSPHYGERWGRHWLDVARFGESDGFERNNPRKNSWHYRDWVIKALNEDMPYDRFVRMQVAGDVMEGGLEGAAAVGFLVAGLHNTVVGSSERMKRIARQDELEEIVGAVSQTFLGLTVNCARCHDHKFDPIRTEEYYRMIAAIDGVAHGEREIAGKDASSELAEIDQQQRDLQTQVGEIDSKARAAILADRKRKKTKITVADRPQPLASWEFEGDLKDSLGQLHGKAVGGARIENGALVVNGQGAYVQTAKLKQDITEKTLEAWVLLDNLDQRGGAAISIQTPGGGVFDAIVFGEREPRRWMAGSNGFVRTKSFAATEENLATSEPVHMAVVYRSDGTIIGYRNGVPYGNPYKTGFQHYKAGQAEVVFGLRHSPAGGNRLLRGKILRANLYDRALSAAAVAASAGVESNFVSEKAIVDWLAKEDREQRGTLKKRLRELSTRRSQLAAQAKAKVYTVNARNPGVMRVHIRGSVTDYGDEVMPGGVSSIADVGADFQLAKNAPDAERRKQLANWITHPSNPIFARVIVNRLWHYHFGTGIVETPNDLGFNGGRPSHPELLDWLATKLKEDGYSLKSVHRRIVTSATYRQASTVNTDAASKDAGNRLLWRYPPRRIEAEVLRDSILKVAGILNPQRGGPGFEDVSITPNNGTTYYEPIDRQGAPYNRRTVYRFSPRGGRSPVLDTFDCPDPSSTAPRRSVTTTPLQALSLLNNSFILQMANQFAKRVETECGKDVSQQIVRAWQLAVGRIPDDDEQQLAAELVSRHGLPTLCRALFNCNEFVVME